MAGPEQRSPMSVGFDWAARIGALGVEFAVPVLLGHFLDRRLGTKPWGLLAGMVLGFAVGIMHLLRIARDSSRPT